jgi:hypothetical protein
MSESKKGKYIRALSESVTLKATEKIIEQRIILYIEYLILIRMVLDFL